MLRGVAVTVAFPVLVAVSAFVAEALGFDYDAGFASITLVPAAVFGAVVGSWWTLALPWSWGGLYLVVLRLYDLWADACVLCDSDDTWGTYPGFFLFLTALPLTVALLVGLGVGAAIRRR